MLELRAVGPFLTLSRIAAQAGVEASGGIAVLASRPLTTPALHWAVRQLNDARHSGASLAQLADRHLLSMREAYSQLLADDAESQVLTS